MSSETASTGIPTPHQQLGSLLLIRKHALRRLRRAGKHHEKVSHPTSVGSSAGVLPAFFDSSLRHVARGADGPRVTSHQPVSHSSFPACCAPPAGTSLRTLPPNGAHASSMLEEVPYQSLAPAVVTCQMLASD